MAEPLRVFYTPALVAPSGSFSPSASKPAAVVRSWQGLGLEIDVQGVRPVTVDQLAAVHDRAWVEDVLAGRAPNGFGNRSERVAASLPYTSGAMLDAARFARDNHTIACAPVSGFHHAGTRASGFCTFNGLIVAARALRAEHPDIHVGIFDCDMHYGDGTDALIRQHRLGSWVKHFTAGATYERAGQAEEFLKSLPRRCRAMRGCDVVLYQAGADPHVDDPLGGWLTTEQLGERDRIVFETFHGLGVPVAWNLAGGYQVEADGGIPVVLEIHANTARAAIAVLGSAGRRAT